MPSPWNKQQLQQRRKCLERLLTAADEDTGTRTLAKRLHKDEPDLFPTLENARAAINYLRGADGKACRKKLTDTRHVRKHRKPGDCIPPKSIRAVPKDWKENWVGKWGLCSDLHVPFHELAAVETAVKGMHQRGCNNLFINGDAVDLYHFSRWFKDPIYGRAEDHWRAQVQMFSWLEQQFDRVVYKLGNHEKRYRDFLGTKAAELMGIPTLAFEEVMQLYDVGIRREDVIEENQLAYLGKCAILHGHELARGIAAPVNPARGSFLKVKDSVVVGHHHRSSTHAERTGLDDRMIVCRSLGCLCQLRASYQVATNWDHGFATVEVDSRRDFEFSNYTMDRHMNVYRV